MPDYQNQYQGNGYQNNVPPQGQYAQQIKVCQYCGRQINANAVICPFCGCQVSQFQQQPPTVVVNNTNTNVNAMGTPRDKWVAVLLCFFLGFLGAHKFYEGKPGMGILYIFTLGLFGIGVLVDFITLLFKPNPYYVYR